MTERTVLGLDCYFECPYELNCPFRFERGTVCVDLILDFIRRRVYGKRSQITVEEGKIKFSTTEPDGIVTVSKRKVIIERPNIVHAR